MVFGHDSEMSKFQLICNAIMPSRVSVLTNYGDWEDRLAMRGPYLKVRLIKNRDDKHDTIRISDERGLAVEIPCEGIEIVEIHNSKWTFEAHIYFFTFNGFARMNIIGEPIGTFNYDEKLFNRISTADL